MTVRIVRDLAALPDDLRGGGVSIGNFDGVHHGHARIIAELREQAQAVGGPAIVFTFDPHPVRLLRPAAAPPPLTWTERKAELLAALGIDAMIAYPTDEKLLALTPREFFDQIVRERLAARGLVEGPNFFFGRARTGDVRLLAEFCTATHVALRIVEPLRWGDGFVSSSRVRELIQRGDVGGARGLLTQPYRIRGLVTHGAARGGRIGFPTANIEAIDTLLPSAGVYAGRAIHADEAWRAAIHIGPNPTFGEHALKVEVHLIGFTGDLYGRPLAVDFLERLRDIRTFASVDELKRQLSVDIAVASRVANTLSEQP